MGATSDSLILIRLNEVRRAAGLPALEHLELEPGGVLERGAWNQTLAVIRQLRTETSWRTRYRKRLEDERQALEFARRLLRSAHERATNYGRLVTVQETDRRLEAWAAAEDAVQRRLDQIAEEL